MIKLGLYNVKNNELVEELKKEFIVSDVTIDGEDQIDTVLFDWTPTEVYYNSPLLERQT